MDGDPAPRLISPSGSFTDTSDVRTGSLRTASGRTCEMETRESEPLGEGVRWNEPNRNADCGTKSQHNSISGLNRKHVEVSRVPVHRRRAAPQHNAHTRHYGEPPVRPLPITPGACVTGTERHRVSTTRSTADNQQAVELHRRWMRAGTSSLLDQHGPAIGHREVY